MTLPPQYSEGFGEGFTGTISAGNIQVHTREDSGNSIEEMFRVVTDPASSISSAKPMKDRNLPPSFFEPSAQQLGVGHLAPAIKVRPASKSPSVASSVSPNLDHLYPDQPDPSYPSASKSSCGSDLALNETFSNINFIDSAQPKTEYHHFRGGVHHRQQKLLQQQHLQHVPAQPQAYQQQQQHLQPVQGDQALLLVAHTRAHSSPAKMSSQQQQQQQQQLGNSKKAVSSGCGHQFGCGQSYNGIQGYMPGQQVSPLPQQQQQQQQHLMLPDGVVSPHGGNHGSSHPNLSTGAAGGEFNNYPRLSAAATDAAAALCTTASKEFPTQEQIDACPLPPGWEMAYSEDSKIYFVDHNSKSTCWMDPRLPSELQSGWGHTAREIALMHQMKCSRCSAYRRLSSLTAQKELLRRQLEATTRNEFLMRQEVFTMQGGSGLPAAAAAGASAQQQQPQQPHAATDHRRQESSDSGLASEPVVTPPTLEINGASFNQQMETADTSVDCLLSSLKDSDLLVTDFEMQNFRQDFQESI